MEVVMDSMGPKKGKQNSQMVNNSYTRTLASQHMVASTWQSHGLMKTP